MAVGIMSFAVTIDEDACILRCTSDICMCSHCNNSVSMSFQTNHNISWLPIHLCSHRWSIRAGIIQEFYEFCY